jgi:inosine-uridine nucleoside N-ribohydrolase
MKKIVVWAAFLAAIAGGLVVRGQNANAVGRPAEPQLVLLDTDIGDDIDDAFALALALRSPEIKLLGVTTAYGDTDLRAKLVDRYLDAVGRTNLPVVAGVPTQASNVFTQAAYARRGPAPRQGRIDGPGFILSQIRAHPGQITLIAIGPLFNVQAAIEKNPATFRKLKRVVLMGGSVNRGYDDGETGAHRPPDAEWNIKCDPAGLRALLGVGVPVFMMPLDSTQIHLGQANMAAIFSHGSALTDQLTLLYHQWSGAGEWKTPTLYDPMTVAFATHPELCPVTAIRLTVDDKGFTRPEAGTPNAQVCLLSDEKGFLDLLMGRIANDSDRSSMAAAN